MPTAELHDLAQSLADELEAAIRLATTRSEHIRLSAAAMKARRLADSIPTP